VLAELERVVSDMLLFKTFSTDYNRGYNTAIQDVLAEIEKHKPTEIDKLKQAFAEGGGIPQSADSWVKKFSQGKID
jgi:hypothetical protein